MQILAVPQMDMEAVSLESHLDLQQMAASALGTVSRSTRLWSKPEESIRRKGLSRSTSIVEDHLRARQQTHLLDDVPLSAEVAEQAIADPSMRHRAKLFFHRLQGLPWSLAMPQVQQHGSDSREPADGAREVNAFGD